MYRPSGIIASLVTHFTPAGAIDQDGIVKTVDFLARRGIHGVCICGGTGEALSLTDEEHATAVEAAVEGAAGRCGVVRSEERRVGKECRWGGATDEERK